MAADVEIVKICGCGRSFSRSEWNRLARCGFMQKGRDVAGELLELRHCPCGSTLGMDLGDGPESDGRISLRRVSVSKSRAR